MTGHEKTPKEIVAELDKYVVGQAKAKKALNDIVRRVKEDSIEQQMNATNDILKWQDLIKEKANLAKLHISL